MDRKEWIEVQAAHFDNNGIITGWDTMLLKKEYITAIAKYNDKCHIIVDWMNNGNMLINMSYEDFQIEFFR